MNDEKVFQLLTETNPVPDPDGLDSPLALTELERRNPIMATRQPNSGNRNNGLLIGAVAAVAVLIVGLGSWAVIADGSGSTTTAAAAATSTSSPSTTTAPTTATSSTEAESLALATVAAHYDALNRGDIPAMLEIVTGPHASDIDDGTFLAILAAANHRGDIIEPCRVLDVGVDHRGFPIDPDNPETVVVCTTGYNNDYFGPAGMLTGPRVERFYVTADGKLIALYPDVGSGFFSDDEVFFGYNVAFYNWLTVAYPEVYEEIKVEGDEWIPGWGNDPEHMAIAIEYIEEFVAQSDVYPIEPDGG